MGKTKGAVTLQKKKTPVIIYLLLYVFALYGAIMIADIWDPELNLYDQLVNIMNHMSVNPFAWNWHQIAANRTILIRVNRPFMDIRSLSE